MTLSQSDKTKKIAKILKKSFPKEPTDKLVHIAFMIAEALEEKIEKVESPHE